MPEGSPPRSLRPCAPLAPLPTSPPALDERQRLNDEYMRGYRAASRMIDAASPEPALDVERLAEAIETVLGTAHGKSLARDFAAEYARLAEQPKERGTSTSD